VAGFIPALTLGRIVDSAVQDSPHKYVGYVNKKVLQKNLQNVKLVRIRDTYREPVVNAVLSIKEIYMHYILIAIEKVAEGITERYQSKLSYSMKNGWICQR
jgi:hypothetical protein